MIIELNSINTTKLHDELIAGGVIPILVESTLPIDTNDTNPIRPQSWFTINDTDKDTFDLIVSKHNPTPIPQPPTDEDRLSAVESAITALMGV